MILPARAAERGDSSDLSRRVAPYAVRIGTSLVINAALTEVLKTSIHEMRPDRSDNDSWPSRHVSWMTTASFIVARELYDRSPWWAVGAHAINDVMMMQRTFSGNHFPKDVLGGMAVGLVSTQLGYMIGNLVYPSSRRPMPAAVSDFMPSLDVTTSALFPLSGGAEGYSGRTAVNTSVRGTLPLSDHWGAAVTANMRSMPLYSRAEGIYAGMIDGIGLAAGAVYYLDLPSSRWNFESRASAGFLRNFHGNGVRRPTVSFTFDLAAGAGFVLTPSLALGAEAGYSLWTLDNAVSALTVGMFTRVLF